MYPALVTKVSLLLDSRLSHGSPHYFNLSDIALTYSGCLAPLAHKYCSLCFVFFPNVPSRKGGEDGDIKG